MKPITCFIILFSLSHALRSQNPLNTGKLDSFFTILSEKNQAMGSFALHRSGQTVYTRCIGLADSTGTPAPADARYRVGSITKVFTAVLIHQLVEAGKLTYETRLSDFYPEMPHAAEITIGQMLNHHSGLHNFTNDPEYLRYFEKPKSKAELLDIFSKMTADFSPGAEGNYSNTAYVLLGFIAEKVAGTDYTSLVKTQICDRIGLYNTYVGEKYDAGKKEVQSFDWDNRWAPATCTDLSIPGAAGAIVSTPADLTLFIRQVFHGSLLKKESLDKMLDMHDGFGFGLFSFPFYDQTCYGHTGGIDGFHSMLCYFPEGDVAFAWTGNGEQYDVNNIMLGAMSIYFEKPFSIPVFDSKPMDPAEMAQYIGVYSSKEIALKITIGSENGRLTGQATGQSAFPLDKSADGSFRFDAAGIVMEFGKNAEGLVTDLTLKQAGYTLKFDKD